MSVGHGEADVEAAVLQVELALTACTARCSSRARRRTRPCADTTGPPRRWWTRRCPRCPSGCCWPRTGTTSRARAAACPWAAADGRDRSASSCRSRRTASGAAGAAGFPRAAATAGSPTLSSRDRHLGALGAEPRVLAEHPVAAALAVEQVLIELQPDVAQGVGRVVGVGDPLLAPDRAAASVSSVARMT